MTLLQNRPRRGRPPQPDRANSIADAAVRVLAEDGSRGLSHRRVDAEAGLPLGSTVHYAPTRGDLLLMSARRLEELSTKELQALCKVIREKRDTLTPQDLAKETMAYLRRRLKRDRFYRLRAEMAVFFSPEFDKEVRELFKPQLDISTELWEDAMACLGVRHPERAGKEFAMWNRGILYLLAACEESLDEQTYKVVQKWIVTMIKSLMSDEDLDMVDTRPRHQARILGQQSG